MKILFFELSKFFVLNCVVPFYERRVGCFLESDAKNPMAASSLLPLWPPETKLFNGNKSKTSEIFSCYARKRCINTAVALSLMADLKPGS